MSRMSDLDVILSDQFATTTEPRIFLGSNAEVDAAMASIPRHVKPSVDVDDLRYYVDAIARSPRTGLGKPRIYAVIRSVAKSGMSRVMDLYTLTPGGDMIRLTPLFVALGIGNWTPDHDGMRVQGTGMDMVFHVTYRLALILGSMDNEFYYSVL